MIAFAVKSFSLPFLSVNLGPPKDGKTAMGKPLFSLTLYRYIKITAKRTKSRTASKESFLPDAQLVRIVLIMKIVFY